MWTKMCAPFTPSARKADEGGWRGSRRGSTIRPLPHLKQSFEFSNHPLLFMSRKCKQAHLHFFHILVSFQKGVKSIYMEMSCTFTTNTQVRNLAENIPF